MKAFSDMRILPGVAFAAGVLMTLSAASAAQAAWVSGPGGGSPPVVRVEGGCGPEGHRGPDGRCYPNLREREGYGREEYGREDRWREGRGERWREERWREERARDERFREGQVACPRGYHYGERSGRCWPN